MTRTHCLKIYCLKILSAAFLFLALLQVTAPAALADEYALCDKVKHGQSGQAYAWKKDC